MIERFKQVTEGTSKEKREDPGKLPIIDVVRHGETGYEELKDPEFKLETEGQGYGLNPESLDLTPEGIRNIENTAKNIVSNMDKQNETVLFVTSPQFRAISSQFVMEKVFLENGVNILNPSFFQPDGEGVKKSTLGLGELPLKNKKEFGRTWLETYLKWAKENPEIKSLSPKEVHTKLAESLGKNLDDILTKSHENIEKDFARFLRHLMNIDKYLSNDTKKKLEGKRVRIVCITHEERVSGFLKDSLGLQKSLEKGQLLEVNPSSISKEGEKYKVEMGVSLFDKQGNEEIKSETEMDFK